MARTLIFLTVPLMSPATIQSPTLNGRSASRISPETKFEQTVVIALHGGEFVAERLDLVGVKQRRRGGAVGQSEMVADRPRF
nr:hypothetical protein [Mesorhizobium sp.]